MSNYLELILIHVLLTGTLLVYIYLKGFFFVKEKTKQKHALIDHIGRRNGSTPASRYFILLDISPRQTKLHDTFKCCYILCLSE